MRPRTALVTGGRGNLGAAVVSRLRAEGYHVLAPSREALDLLSAESIRGYCRGLDGPIDVLVNNAGVNDPAPATALSDRVLEDTVAVNLLAPVRLVRELAPGMIDRGYGRIVNVSSVLGSIGRAGRVAYSATKAGLDGVTRTLAVEFGGTGVLVNAIAPGYVDSDLTRKNNPPEQLERIRAAIPLQRLAHADEIANVVSFLCSERNSYMTGQVLVVDGGFTCT